MTNYCSLRGEETRIIKLIDVKGQMPLQPGTERFLWAREDLLRRGDGVSHRNVIRALWGPQVRRGS